LNNFAINRSGLISDGMMSYTRNPNYLGEMMIYGSFALLVNDTISYVCITHVWFTLFVLRMYAKEVSFKKKEGWTEYSAKSWILFPKINGRWLDSIICYGLFIYFAYVIYTNGGFKKSLIKISKNYLRD
jgi:steroid 5-alpha reductase family enzyme